MSGRGPLGINHDQRYELRRSARNVNLNDGNGGSRASDQDSSKNESEKKRRESKKRPQQVSGDEEVQEVAEATERQKKKSRGTGKEKKGAEPRDSRRRLAIQPRDEPEDAVPLEYPWSVVRIRPQVQDRCSLIPHKASSLDYH